MGEAEMVFMRTGAADFPSMGTGGTGTGSISTGSTGSGRPGETVVLNSGQNQVMGLADRHRRPVQRQVIPAQEGDNTIGRATDNDLVLEDNSASRSHAMVRVQEGRFVWWTWAAEGALEWAATRCRAGPSLPEESSQWGRRGCVWWLSRLRRTCRRAPYPAKPSVDVPGGASAVLIAQSGPDSGQSFLLSTGDTAIGREPGSQVLLTDEAVSRRHALVRSEAGRVHGIRPRQPVRDPGRQRNAPGA